MTLNCLILAAGEGKRMRSALAKPLHRVCGKTLIAHVLDGTRALQPQRIAVVLGVGREAMLEALAGETVEFAFQEQQLGTGHAVRAAAELFADSDGDLLVTCADIPLVQPETLQALLAEHHARGAVATVLTALYDDPMGYGRIVRDERGLVTAIVEHRDASDDIRAIHEINSGIYVFQARPLFAALARLKPDNAQGEYYLTDVIADFVSRGEPVAALPAADPTEVMGINDRVQLAAAEQLGRRRVCEALMRAGVTLIDPGATYVEAGVTIGRDTIIWPGAVVTGATTIGEGCTLGPNVQIADSQIGDACEIKQSSVLTSCAVGDEAQVGPFAHIRPGSVMGAGSHLGSHTELVRSRLGAGVKCMHFSYLGDATVGAGSNIGAGTITCNYDGETKHPTVIGEQCFIGSDAILVAPVTLGDGAYVAAGSVITKDVPSDALGIGRSDQRNLEEWARKRREKRGQA
jgi:bifunctional UDP-N-acetylglucosamine pyrophosphorylase / glucosamine-1-phosphate N-acetyltransferase